MKKEEYKNLKQLDRIEYLLRKNRINDWNLMSISFISQMIYLGFFIMIFAILFLGFWKSTAILKVFPIFLMVFRYGLIIMVVIDVFQIIISYLKSKRLDEEFLKKEDETKNVRKK